MKGLGRRGVSLVEILVVVAIIGVLSAVVFAATMGVRGSTRRTTCLSNLHQVGLAMALYRGDWNDQNPKDRVLTGPPPERLAWTLLESYAKTKAVFMCPDEAGADTDSLGYIYRSGPKVITDADRTVLGLEPTSVTAYCMEHLKKSVVQGHYSYVDFEMDANKQYSGRFQYLRADSSAKSVDAKQVETWVSDGKAWYKLAEVPAGLVTFIRTERFPGESWPPEFQL